MLSTIAVKNVNADTVYSGGHVYSGHSDKVHGHFFLVQNTFIRVYSGRIYSGQSDIVSRKWWPKVNLVQSIRRCVRRIGRGSFF